MMMMMIHAYFLGPGGFFGASILRASYIGAGSDHVHVPGSPPAGRELSNPEVQGRWPDFVPKENLGQVNCSDYQWTKWGMEWIPGSCTGIYHYADPSCGHGCLLLEGFYWSLTSWLGGQDMCHCGSLTYRCCAIWPEWEACRPRDMAELPQASLAHRLVAGLDPSQRHLGYVLPQRLPDGDYRGQRSVHLAQSCRGAPQGCTAACR